MQVDRGTVHPAGVAPEIEETEIEGAGIGEAEIEEARAEALALPEQVYARVFRRLRPRTKLPEIRV
jgi:hypothetical protein